MRHVLIAVMALAATWVAAVAALPEDDYVAARDAYLKRFNDTDIVGDDRAAKAHEAARLDLERRLRQIVGPTRLAGFGTDGKISLQSLAPGFIGYGLLDGLVYESADAKTQVLVTTDRLFGKWLAANSTDVPQFTAQALTSDAFYTHALYTEAAFFKYAELPITARDGALARALLIAHAQDIGPVTPDKIIVALVRAPNVFIVTAPATAKIEPMPACTPIWQDATKRAQALLDAYAQSEPQDDKLFDQYTRTQENGDLAYRQCFAEQARRKTYFPALVAQAQALVDGLPAK